MKKALISFRNVSKIYKLGEYEIKALDKFSLDIKKGEFVVVMGPSGSGKSTFLNLVGFLDVPTEGEMLLEGEDVSKLNEAELAAIRNRAIGFVFQSYNLLPRISAQENVEVPLIYAGVGAKERKKRSLEALGEVGLENREGHASNQLSGGQQQRVAIARALVNNPTIILADEPTGNLDTKSGKEVMEILCAIHKKGRTIVMVTHDPQTAKCGSRIVRLVDGKIDSVEERK